MIMLEDKKIINMSSIGKGNFVVSGTIRVERCFAKDLFSDESALLKATYKCLTQGSMQLKTYDDVKRYLQ